MPAISAAIRAVTVYPDRARITRQGRAHLTAGEQELILSNVPATIDPDSVRASGRGANVRILGVEVRRRFVSEAPEERIAELQGQLQTLQDADQALADEEAVVESRLALLTTLRDSGGTALGKSFAYGRTSIENVEALEAHISAQWEAALARRREIAASRRDLARQIEAAEGQLSTVQQVEPGERREIVVGVEAAAETDLELELLYVTSGATWHSIYDARLVGDRVTLTYLAGVQQTTGEDWPAVELSLSTARPAISKGIPELDPWYIDAPRPRAAYPMQTFAAGGAPAAAPQDMMTRELRAESMPEPAPQAKIAEAEIVNSGAAVTYRVARPVAVPSDGSPHRTTITTLDLGAALDYITIPKLAEEAYLRAKVRNTSRFMLLPGPASIFHDADFVGTTDLELIVPNEEFEMQLGVDDRIKVERELAEHSTGKSFIGNTRRIVYGYRIKLRSLLEAPTRITVFDQIPLPRHEDIKVKPQEVLPPPTEQTDLGRFKWDLTLPPNQEQIIDFTFIVEHPRNMTVIGIG